MKIILYYEVVFDKNKIKGDRPEYGIGPFWLCWAVLFCDRLSHWALSSKIYLEKYLKHKKGKIEKL